MKFEDYFKKFEFLLRVILQNNGENYIFQYHECHFNDHIKRFHHFRLRYHNLIFPPACFTISCRLLNTQCFRVEKTALIQSWFSLKQRWIFQFWTALIQRKSELISADALCVLWMSAEKHQNSETALYRADYLWDFTLGIEKVTKYGYSESIQNHLGTRDNHFLP